MSGFLRGVVAIYRKEMGHYLVSPVAYVVLGMFLLIGGLFYYTILTFYMERSLAASMQAMQFGAPPEVDVPSMTINSLFGVLGQVALFLLPMATMGVYAEERRRGTIELLMTSPVTDWQIVLGKYLASFSLFLILLLPTLAYHGVLFWKSEPRPPLGIMLSGYLGLLLLGGAFLALGNFISSLTESQLIAAVVTFCVALVLWIIDIAGPGAGTTIGELFQYLSVLRHYEDFARGVVDTTSLVFFGSWIALGLFLTLRSLDSMRWRRA
ncbi:MAG: ABC transporter permease subunit [Acidobacteriia bacterium]|jgi:ABC-2 type transport system permease protein|nr:ABC transporter permease subunit [Terriglobia bacterium]